ncbi:MAG: hypothetical protein ACR2O3_00495 [Rhizobiaceae bacterium]
MKNRNKIKYILIGSTLMLAGCQQYLVRQDTVAPEAGNHLAVNEAKMVVDPWNRDAYNNRIEGDGKRLADAVERYKDANSEDAGNDQQTIFLPTVTSGQTN